MELTFAYQNGGCGKTLTKINDTMPHTWTVWGVCTRSVHSHIAIQEMSAVRYPLVIENYHISILGHRKHFQYVYYSNRIALQN